MPAKYYGWNPPFFGGPQKVLSRQEDIRLIKNDILQLLMTLPGERVHRPDFGTRLRATLFEPMSNDVLGSLQSELVHVLRTEEPRITDIEVILTPKKSERRLDVTVLGKLSGNPNIKIDVELKLRAPGAAGP